MRFLVLLILLGGAFFGLYLFIFHLRKIDWKIAKISAAIGFTLVGLFAVIMLTLAKSDGGWCTYYHTSTNYPPAKTETAMDYFELGNFYYDIGKCGEAIESYAKSIDLDPEYPEVYNNRAYTYMRLEQYDLALTDLNHAIELKPDYKNALMNRADIYNYRKNNKEAAVADYERVLSIVGTRKTDICAHLADAKYGGNFFTALSIPLAVIRCR